MLSCVRSSCFRLWVPAHPCKPRPFFSAPFFPFYTFPFLFLTGKHLMSARNPQRVSSPCSLLSSLVSTQRYSHPLARSLTHVHTHTSLSLPLRLSPLHTPTRYPPLPILLTFLSSLTQHLFSDEVMKFLSKSLAESWIRLKTLARYRRQGRTHIVLFLP